MIHYVVPGKFRGHSIDPFLNTWGKTLGKCVRPITYQEFFRTTSLQPGVMIFTHFEGLSLEEETLVRAFFNRHSNRKKPWRLLNDPARALDRYHLGMRLFTNGINDFRPWYLDEDLSSVRFPAFVRLANEHGFWDPVLVQSPEALENAIGALRSRVPGLEPRDAIVLEYSDVSVGGVYRKYSALRIGDEILPRHILFSSNWMTKYPDLIDSATAGEELDFVENFEHAEILRPVFELAGIEYGRIDYSIHEGRLRVWEINTNPVIVPPPGEVHPDRMKSQTRSAERIVEAFKRLEAEAPRGKDARVWRWFDRWARRKARAAGKQFVKTRDGKLAELTARRSRPQSDS